MRMFHEMRSEGTTQRAHQLPLFHANSPAVVPAKLEPIGALGFGRFGSSFFLLGAVTPRSFQLGIGNGGCGFNTGCTKLAR